MTEDAPLPPLAAGTEQVVRDALAEDLGTEGDVTSQAVLPPGTTAHALLRSREEGIAAGLEPAAWAFRFLDPALAVVPRLADGDALTPGSVLLEVSGSAASILAAERVAVNFAQRLSGVASATRRVVEAIGGHPTRLLCTRKTTPTLRTLEKLAVRAGGGHNHRAGLFDAILIKDNHLAILGGDISVALRRARNAARTGLRVQIEVDTLDQLQLVLETGLADSVLLDNFALPELRRAVALCAGKLATEASGNIRPRTAAAIAATGVEAMSSGWITHSARALDLGLDIA